MKGLIVLLALLAVIGGAIMGAGYYLYGDKFYDILTAAEARLTTQGLDEIPVDEAMSEAVDEVQDSMPIADQTAGGQGVTDTNAAAPDTVPAGEQPIASDVVALPPQPVRFEDSEGRFAAVFPGQVSRFDNYLSGLVPELISSSQTYAASGLDIVAQVSILTWREEVLATAADLATGFADDPDRTMGEEVAQSILTALLGDGATVEGVRGFDAFGRQSVELTGLIPDGDGGLHKSVVWLMPDANNLIAVVIRAYNDRGLLGTEATQFNQNFSLQVATVPTAETGE